MDEKRVAIVGAGISGLLACKYAAAKGFTPVVFEEQDKVGGLWNHTLESTTLQVPKQLYEFSDFPWPSSVKELLPHNTQLTQYLQSYAQKFQLLQYVNFNSTVIDVDYVGESEEEMNCWGGDGKAFRSKRKWILKVSHSGDHGSIKVEYEAEFLVLCIGKFSGLPNIPEFAPGYGSDAFSGKVMHSMDLAKMENAAAAKLIKGKRVVVIGSGKSAVDIAYECANLNGRDNPCTMVQRRIHWMIPHDAQPWGLSFSFLFFTRFAELMLHKPGQGSLFTAATILLTPLRWVVNKLVEIYLKWRLPIKKYDMVPTENFVGQASSCQIHFLQPNFYDRVEDGSILMKKSKSFTFCKEGVILEGEAVPLQADVVIFATGYKGKEKLKNMFASPTFQNYIYGSPNSIVPLYRQMIHPRIPQLAVIGYTESLSCLFTFEMRCKWLSHFLDGEFRLPNIREMEKEMEGWEKYMKRYAGKGRSCIGGVPIWYNDQLCRDIGSAPKRKNGFISELFQPYGPPDYHHL
ncbi:probable flavin-containing monooxygenase 1 isoform X1 [Salvia splendens]|uniref:probable flavin-containing monooxygenase 1 isoform X1 n=1 Tax=Salvia splendens TaxID=180675 RepID=UPI001C2616AC|nr:probable flavin-containing monooxygenase 1 isoform X1 [Salvia splendens]